MKTLIATLTLTLSLSAFGCSQETADSARTVASGSAARAHGVAGYEVAVGDSTIEIGLRDAADLATGRLTIDTARSSFVVAELGDHVVTTELRGDELAVTLDGVELGSYAVVGDELVIRDGLAVDGAPRGGLTLEDARPYLDVIDAVLRDPALHAAVAELRAERSVDLLVPYYSTKAFCDTMQAACMNGSDFGCVGYGVGLCWLS